MLGLQLILRSYYNISLYTTGNQVEGYEGSGLFDEGVSEESGGNNHPEKGIVL